MSAPALHRLAHPKWQVPAFTAEELAPRRHAAVLCLPVINENGRLHAQLERIASLALPVDVLIADGGSTDGSVATEALARRDVSELLVKVGPGRLGAQMRMAMAWALERGYERLVFMDGNGKDDPAAIPLFLEQLERGVDHVQGSRYVPGGRGINTPLSRHLAVRHVHAPLVALAAGYPYTDTTNGFRGYSARLLLDARVQPFRDAFSGYELHYYLAIRAARLGFRVAEVPVTRAYPETGPVPTKISPFRGRLAVLAALLRACTGAFDPPEVLAETA